MVDRLVNTEANARRIANVESCFGSSGQPLAVPGRVLVGEGVLTKMCRKKLKPRQFFLFNDILVYGNIVVNKKMYNKQHIIPLEEVKLENLEDDGALKNGWLIRTPTKSFAVYAATSAEKSEWMAHIKKCVEDLLKKTGKKPSIEHAAVWVPDAEARICMHCRKTQFTVINRRHHCRKCGAVICGPCSNKKFLLPSQSSKPLRVCLSCYDTLSRAKTAGMQAPSKPSADGMTAQVVAKPTLNQPESSGEEDSDDEEEDQAKRAAGEGIQQGEEDHVATALGEMSVEDKPTFYGDAGSNDKGGDATTEETPSGCISDEASSPSGESGSTACDATSDEPSQ